MVRDTASDQPPTTSANLVVPDKEAVIYNGTARGGRKGAGIQWPELPYDRAMSSVDRKQVTLHRSLAGADDGGYMPGTPEQRILQVWELTRESWAFLRQGDAEQRLQRNVAVLVRGER